MDCRWDVDRQCYAYVLAKPTRLRSPRRAKNAPQPVFWRPQF